MKQLLSHPEDFNIDLATKVLDQITRQPWTHDQSVVMNECGTSGCIAGWTNLLHNPRAYKKAYKKDSYMGMDDARLLLGLPYGEARRLFSGGLPESEARKLLSAMIAEATQYWVDIARQAERAEEKHQRKLDRAARRQAWTTWTLPRIGWWTKKAERVGQDAHAEEKA